MCLDSSPLFRTVYLMLSKTAKCGSYIGKRKPEREATILSLLQQSHFQLMSSTRSTVLFQRARLSNLSASVTPYIQTHCRVCKRACPWVHKSCLHMQLVTLCLPAQKYVLPLLRMPWIPGFSKLCLCCPRPPCDPTGLHSYSKDRTLLILIHKYGPTELKQNDL